MAFGTFFLLGLLFVTVANDDLYGRSTESTTLENHPFLPNVSPPPQDTPTVYLVIHRILLDENAVEVSVIVEIRNGPLLDSIRKGHERLVAELHDASGYQPHGVFSSAEFSGEGSNGGGLFSTAQTSRFQLSVMPSVSGYPFDDIDIRAFIDLTNSQGFSIPFYLKVQKALPGRLISVQGNATLSHIRLTRLATEKAMVVTSAMVFLVLSTLVAVGLFSSKDGLNGQEELLAVAGYMVAAAGFRELLGISRLAGTSALEVGVVGVPLALLGVGLVVSRLRSWKLLRSQEQGINQAQPPSAPPAPGGNEGE